MTDRVLIENPKTGSLEVKQLGYMLPLFDLGDVVIYNTGGIDGEDEVVGIQMCVIQIDGEIKTMAIYTLANGLEISEEEISEYYPDTEEEEYEEEQEENWQKFLEAFAEDERDPIVGPSPMGPHIKGENATIGEQIAEELSRRTGDDDSGAV